MSSAQNHVKIDLPPESSSHLRYPAWEREYESALLEGDPAKLVQRIAQAEAAIFKRLQALMSHSSDGHAERHAIQDALTALRVIKRETLDSPNWESSGSSGS
jgi:hypothetical protein